MTSRALILLMLLTSLATAQPLIVPDATILNLDDIGLYGVGYAYRGQPEREFPIGWSGSFDDQTGVACEPQGVQKGKAALLLHCPWRNGTGVAFQQFQFQLPKASRILLRGATAMRSDSVGRSDGVTFSVYTNGSLALQYHQTNDLWRLFEFDLTSLAGSRLAVRFAVDPGPKGNSAFDFALWGDRHLVLEGFTAPSVSHPAPRPLALSNVWSAANGEVAPRDGFGGTTSVQFSDRLVRFRYKGPGGTLTYAWSAPQSTNGPLFGDLTLTAQMDGDGARTIPLAGESRLSWTAKAILQTNFFEITNNGAILRQQFQLGTARPAVTTVGQLVGKSLVLSITCDQPLVETFDGGGWGPVLRRRRVTVPYLPAPAYYLPHENLFVSAFLDWTASGAASHHGTRAYYQPLTDGSRNPLRERLIFSAAWHQAEVFPNLPNPPSPYRAQLADKVVLDIWGGNFRTVADHLETLADYGITNCIALIHVWQRSGYDNALPAHIPANARQGGDEGMSHLVATASRLGMTAALHENYVDYYPNYEGFDTNDIALDSRGNLVKAWYNEGTKIQSFGVKPGAILRLAAAQSPEIHRRYGTAANYLDVHSAVPPWFHVDFRAREAGSGRFERVWDVHRRLFAYERATHGGPVFGEGNAHAYWSGCLDGVEAQFGTGWPDKQGMTAPLHVDFDLLKIHPLQFNHGMGYYERWWPEDASAKWRGSVPLVVLDQYRVQEIAYGHAGFLGGILYSRIPYAWLEYHLMSPLTARYGEPRPIEIAYFQDGRWLDPTAAAKAETSRDRVRISYDSGLTITANGSTNRFALKDWVLPPFGWVAQTPGFRAGTVLRQDVATDFADSGDSLFVNARNVLDWKLSDVRRVRPSVAAFERISARSFRVTYQWDAQEKLPKGLSCFVHFAQGDSIRFQQDHAPWPPTAGWQTGQVVRDGPFDVNIPKEIPDGDYDWLIGLFDPVEGGRINLTGPDAGQSRIRLGTLRLAGNGNEVTFVANTATGQADHSAVFLANLNQAGAVINFGDVRTDGSAWVRRQGQQWVLKTWPRDRAFVLEFSGARFGTPAVVRCDDGRGGTVAPVVQGDRWRLPLTGAREYRWVVKPEKD